MHYIEWDSLSGTTKLLMNQLHYGALAFMVVAYAIKIKQLLAKPVALEGTTARGDHGAAIRYAYMTLAMPWELESTRTHWFRYVEFVVFHIAMAVGIGFAFVTPILHESMKTQAVALPAQILFGLGAAVGLSRLLRRLGKAEMRAISSPDDYFCLFLLTAWMAAGVVAAPLTNANALLAFFALATFFLVYVPFSKISHYVYWPFIRFYVGRHFGHRGVFPKKGSIG
jgi:nitrate reductase gamma subunit